MKKRKLCFVIPQYDATTTTHYAHIYALLEELGKKLDIFLFAESGNPPVKIQHLKGFHIQRYRGFPLRMAERWCWFMRLRMRGYRMFYCHYSEVSAIIAAVMTRVFGGTTFKWHCAQEHYYRKPWSLKNLQEKIRREIPLHLSLRLVQYVVTCSPLLVKYYQRHFRLRKGKMLVIPGMVDITMFKTEHDKRFMIKKQLGLPNKPIALYVHRFSKRKGADRLLRMAMQVKRKRWNFCIVAVGDGPLWPLVRRQITRYRLEEQFVLHEAVPSSAVADYYHASDVFIMPSRIEEFGRVLVEAMAAGLPIIATKTFGTDYVLTQEQQAMVVPQSDYRTIPEKMMSLLNDRKRLERLSSIGRQRAETFSVERIAPLFLGKIAKG